MNIILPADVFWLPRVPVAQGGSTPFHLWLLWAYQFMRPAGLVA